MGRAGGSEQSSQSSELVQVQPDSANIPGSPSSSTARALSPVNQVVEEPAGAPLSSSSSTSSSLAVGPGQAQVPAAQPPPPAENIRFVRQQQQPQYLQPLQPLQPQQIQQPEEDENEEADYEFDSLNAPYERQLGKIFYIPLSSERDISNSFGKRKCKMK